MKIKDIAKSFELDAGALQEWVVQAGVPHKVGLSGAVIVDEAVDITDLVGQFKRYLVTQQQYAAAAQEYAAAKQEAIASMLITSGFGFEGYAITRYSGYISGDDAVSMDRPTQGWLGGVNGNVGAGLLAGLSQIRRNALAELKEAAFALGCNAVIGVDFDYLTLDPETRSNSGQTMYLPFLFAVTANGNAVVIEKKTS